MKTNIFQNKIFLRLVSLAMSILMLCPVYGFASDSQETSSTEQSILKTEAFTVLKRLSMLAEDSEFYSDEFMTRGDFSYILARLAGYREGYVPGSSFSDLETDDINTNAIGYLADINVVKGTGSGLFYPDDYITYAQAAKMTVTALGFSSIAEAKYPENPMGYLMIANDLDLFRGYKSASTDVPVTCKDAIEILFMTAQSSVAYPQAYYGDSMTIARDESKTLLSINYDIHRSKGIMTDNGITSLDGATAVRKGGVVIGNIVLSSTSEGALFENLIGERVEFWYDKSNERLLYAAAEKINNEVVRITYDNLLPDNDSFNISTIVCENKNKTVRKLKLSPTRKLIYNGSAYPSHTTDDLKIDSGYMDLIDIDNDSVYDVVKVYEYKNDVIYYMNVEEGVIKTRYHELMLNMEDWENVSVHMSDGTTGSMYELAVNQPVSLLLSKDNNSLTIIDCSESVITGSFDAIDADGETIDIDGREYRLAKTSAVNMSTLTLGSSYTFYFNADGAVFAVDTTTQDGWTLSYCVKIAKEKGLNGNVQMRVVTAGNREVVYTLNEKVKVNDASKSSEDLLTDLRFINGSGNTIRQPLHFKFDDLGNVNKIEVAVDNTTNPYHINLSEFSKDYVATGSVKSRMDSAYIVACTFLVVPSTNIFVDPYMNDPSANGQTDGVECLVRTDLKIHSSINECVIYDVNEYLQVSAMVTKSLGVGTDAFEPYVLTVGKYTQIMDENGEYVGKIQGVAGDSLMNWSLSDDCYITGTTDIKPGYVFCYRRNREGKLERLDFLYDLNDQSVNWTHSTNHPYNENMGYLYSPVYSASENGVVTIMPQSGIERGYYLMGTAFLNGKRNGALYDRKTKEVRLASGNDIYGAYVPNNDGSLDDADILNGGTSWIFIRRRNSYFSSYVLVIN